MPSLVTVVDMDGLRHALNAFLDAHDVMRLRQTARSFHQLHVLHLRVAKVLIRGKLLVGTLELIYGGLRTLELVGCDLQAGQMVDMCEAVRARGVLEKLVIRDTPLCGCACSVAAALANIPSLAELTVAGLGLEVYSVINVVSTMRAMTKLNMSNNTACAAGGKALADALNGNQVMTELDLADNSLGRVKKNGDADMSGVIAICNAIPTMGALVNFDISSNELRAEGCKALADALKDNKIMKELNISSNYLASYSSYVNDMSGVIAICDAIPTMGALTSLTISGDHSSQSKPVTIETTMTEADFTGKTLQASGAIMLAAFIPKCR